MGCHWKVLNKDGHQSCNLENVGKIGMSWKQQSPGISLRPKKVRNSAEEVGMESRDIRFFFFLEDKKQAYCWLEIALN